MWRTVSLGEVCTISSSKRIFANEYQSVGIPFYRGKEIIEKHNGNNITTELFISQERYEEIRKKYDVPKKGDILLTSVGTLGVPWLVDEENFYFKDGNLTWFRCNSELLPDYLYFWFHSFEAKTQIDSRFIGSTQKALTIDSLKKFRITIPPIDLQKKIISVIRPLEQQIIINRSINENLECQISTLYKSWFEDFELNGGVCPEKWKNQKFSLIANFSNGKRPSIKDKKLTKNTPYPIIGAASVMGFTSNFNHTDKILVIGRVGTHGIVQRFNIPCWVSDNAITIKSNFYEFTHQVLKRIDYSSLNRGSTQPLITQSDLKKVNILVPDIKSLEKFENIAGTLMNQWEVRQQENIKLSILRDTLLTKLISGEIDVSSISI